MVHSSNKDILIEEIKSWEHFEYALREENRLLFNKCFLNVEGLLELCT
jgi:hypothetical protein